MGNKLTNFRLDGCYSLDTEQFDKIPTRRIES